MTKLRVSGRHQDWHATDSTMYGQQDLTSILIDVRGHVLNAEVKAEGKFAVSNCSRETLHESPQSLLQNALLLVSTFSGTRYLHRAETLRTATLLIANYKSTNPAASSRLFQWHIKLTPSEKQPA